MLLMHNKQWSDQVTILHRSLQLGHYDICNIVTWLDLFKLKLEKQCFYKIAIMNS